MNWNIEGYKIIDELFLTEEHRYMIQCNYNDPKEIQFFAYRYETHTNQSFNRVALWKLKSLKPLK